VDWIVPGVLHDVGLPFRWAILTGVVADVLAMLTIAWLY
jgi:hypothetical protein